MALSSSGVGPGLSPIASSQNLQYFRFLTGLMTDQALTIKYTAAIGGGDEAVDAHKLTLVGTTSQTGYMLRTLLAFGDANPSMAIDKNGKISWGTGGGTAVDTTLQRVGAATLAANGPIRLDEIAGAPAAPGAGYGMLYFKTDDALYIRAGAAGVEKPVLTASGATTDPLLAQIWN